MKRRNFFIFCLLIVAFSLGLTSFAQDGNMPKPDGRAMHPPHHNPAEFLSRELNLTSEQKDKVQAIITTEHSTVKSIMEKSLTNHQKLQDLIKSGNFDLAEVRAIAENQANNQILLLVEKQRSHSQIYAILTSEQQAKLDQTHSKLIQNRPMPPISPNQDRMVEMLSHRLSLSSEQQGQLQNVFARQKDSITPLLERLGDFHQQLAALTAKGQFDEAQILGLSRQYLPSMADLIVAHTTMHFNIYSILSAEQREEFLRFPPFPGGLGAPFPGSPRGPQGFRPPRQG
ncbi:MAG: Spy/CpxP family protein refolding chaperone [Acidobacteria bacterium]|nr:Spy/CpxP family protein refolding chaperone [Acidobacteriota bacterium]